ncbi:MAG: CAP domain-containing protein [Chthoniobacteraceae bacterium]
MVTRTVTGAGTTASSPWIDPSTRETVRSYYLQQYLASNGVPIQWTGSLSGVPGQHATGSPGTTSTDYKQAIIARINWFRSMAGVPAVIGLDNNYSAEDQKAALMMAANNQLSHTPPSSWILYSSAGAEAAGKSNLALGRVGPSAITAYMIDYGNNGAAGHRRWIVYPQTQNMGTGDIPRVSSFAPANATWVVDENYGTTRPATRDGYVAWPPPGYVPYEVVFPRWSFTYPDADFSKATVTMTHNGNAVPVALETVEEGYGENTLVWAWNGIDPSTTTTPMDKPANDTTYHVEIDGVKIGSGTQSFSYAVTVFDPETVVPAYQPDLWMADWGQADWVGNNTYNATAANQNLSRTLLAGKYRKLKIKLQNDGNVADTFTLTGSAASSGFKVAYFDGSQNVTASLVAGTYKVRLKAGGVPDFDAPSHRGNHGHLRQLPGLPDHRAVAERFQQSGHRGSYGVGAVAVRCCWH